MPGIAALIAHLSFWTLLVCGWWLGELRPRALLLYVTSWLAGFIGRAYVPYGTALFPPYVAVLAISLVFVVFKGDVRLR